VHTVCIAIAAEINIIGVGMTGSAESTLRQIKKGKCVCCFHFINYKPGLRQGSETQSTCFKKAAQTLALLPFSK
jgi:hypothetical protein